MANTAATQPDINKPPATDVPGEVWGEGDLPAQGFGQTTLMPGIDNFLVPASLAQLWDKVDVKMNRPGHKDNGKTITRQRLKFDKNVPLVVADGPNKGETFTMNVTSNPRPRGKVDDPATMWVSDLAYMLEIGFGDKSRPTTAEALKAQINKYAGKTIRIEHGLSAHCRPDKVRYIIVKDAAGAEKTVPDPTGQKGCGDDSQKRPDGKGKKGRFFTRDFKDPESGEYMDTIECDCAAVLRGFPSLERFVPALGK